MLNILKGLTNIPSTLCLGASPSYVEPTYDWKNDTALKGMWSVYDIKGDGNDILGAVQGNGSVTNMTRTEYEGINSAGYSSGLVDVMYLYNQAVGGSARYASRLRQTQSTTSYRPSIAYAPYNRFDYVQFNNSGQYTGESLEVSQSDLTVKMDEDFTIVVVAQNQDQVNDIYSNYPFIGGFHYAESMGNSVNDDFRGLHETDAYNSLLNARSHDSTSSTQSASSLSTSFSNTAYQTIAGTFTSGSNATCDARSLYVNGNHIATNNNNVSNVGHGTSAFAFFAVGARRGGFGGNADRIAMKLKAVLLYDKVLTADEITTIYQELPDLVGL